MGAAAIGAASFLTEDEKREAVRYGPRVKKDGGGEGGDVAATMDGGPGDGPGGGGDGANGGAWRNQPRDAEGRWTDGGTHGSNAASRNFSPRATPQKVSISCDDLWDTDMAVCRSAIFNEDPWLRKQCIAATLARYDACLNKSPLPPLLPF